VDAQPADVDPDEDDGDPSPQVGDTLELAFDIVFSFTLAQLATLLVDDHSTDGFVSTFLIIVLIWWTFGSYASLDRASATRRARPSDSSPG